MPLEIGVYRTRTTPPWGVELAGLGYYLERTWERVRDELCATALVAWDGQQGAALVAADLMYGDPGLTQAVRQEVARVTPIAPDGVCLCASHSHNAPTAGVARGVGERDAAYVSWLQRQIATAVVCAWRARQPATVHVGESSLEGMTFNRTRQGGAADTTVSVLRVDAAGGRPLAAVVSFHAHPTIMMALGERDVSRDYPGQVVDLLEAAHPGCTALFLQGSCGDVNFAPNWGTPERCAEPGRALAGRALEALARSAPSQRDSVGVCRRRVGLPTRRYAREEVERELAEGRYRLASGDTAGWRDSLGRVNVNYPDRFPSRYGGDVGRAVHALARFTVEWTEEMLADLEARLEVLETEVQALRLGDGLVVAHPAELFSSFSLELRQRVARPGLIIAGYANDAIGYMPDSHDIERRSYAATQSPKFCGHFPFVPESGEVLVQAMAEALAAAEA